MKQVIIDNNTTAVHVLDVSSKKFYGILQINSDKTTFKGFISRERFERGCFIPLCLQKLTQGNSWPRFREYSNFRLLIEAMLNYGMFQIFEFEQVEELMAWLAQ